MEDRARFAAQIFEKALCIEDRTIRCNYASAYAVRLHLRLKFPKNQFFTVFLKVLWKLYQMFSGVWHDLGYAWDDVEEWMVQKHIPAMQVIHVEVN